MATKNTSKPAPVTFTSSVPIVRDKGGWHLGNGPSVRHHEAENAASRAGDFGDRKLPPSEQVVAALAELDNAQAELAGAIERGRMLDAKAESARRAAIAAVRDAVLGGGTAEEVETFDLDAAVLASEGEVAGYLARVRKARSDVLAAADAAQEAWITWAAENGPKASADALESARAAVRAVRAAASAREIAQTGGTRYRGGFDLSKIRDAAERLERDLEAAGGNFEIDTTVEPDCYPSVRERKYLTEGTRTTTRWDDHSAWIARLEKEEGYKLTRFTLGWPEVPSHFEPRGSLPPLGYDSFEDQANLERVAESITGGTSVTPDLPASEPEPPRKASTDADSPEAAMAALERTSSGADTPEAAFAALERPER